MKAPQRARRLAIVGALGIATIILATVAPLPAVADDRTDSAFDLIRDAAPDVASGAHDDAVQTPDGLVYDVDSGAVTTPLEPSEPVKMTIDGVDYAVALPVSADAVLASDDPPAPTFDNNNGSSTSVVVKDDHLTFASILEDVSAPSHYSYDYSQMGELRQDLVDGAVSVWRDGVMISSLYDPWAVDATGTSVPTHYVVDGSTLTQVVDHTAREYVYPIVADPTQTLPGSNSYYSKIVLNINSGAGTTTVSVYPKSGVNWQRVPRSTGIQAYDDIVPSTYEARKYHDQLVCHWMNAGNQKTPWNLDSWRPDVGYDATVAAKCNP